MHGRQEKDMAIEIETNVGRGFGMKNGLTNTTALQEIYKERYN